MILGERIKERLAQLGMSQSELARRVGITQKSMNYLCNQAKSRSAHTHSIASELEVSIEWLTGQTDHMRIGHTISQLTSQQRKWLSFLDVMPEKERAAAFLMMSALADAVTGRKSHRGKGG